MRFAMITFIFKCLQAFLWRLKLLHLLLLHQEIHFRVSLKLNYIFAQFSFISSSVIDKWCLWWLCFRHCYKIISGNLVSYSWWGACTVSHTVKELKILLVCKWSSLRWRYIKATLRTTAALGLNPFNNFFLTLRCLTKLFYQHRSFLSFTAII